MCGSRELASYLDLGHQPPADSFRRPERLSEPETRFPLRVLLCLECGLSQLSYVVRPEILYQDEYPYEASTTAAGQRHFASFARSVVRQLGLGERDLVVDIGSNVGVLLAAFREAGVRVAGIDPAENIAAIANARGIPTVPSFFGAASVEAVLGEHGPACVVTGTNVFAHIDDLDAFMRDARRLLRPGGVLIIEAPYFVNLIDDLEYDTIYHEHLSYISVRPLVSFLARFGMRIFDVREVDIHGGSFRIFIDGGERPPRSGAAETLLEREERAGAQDLGRLHSFARDVARNREQVAALLYQLRFTGARLAGVSAPAKGMTLLNYCGIDRQTLEFITEKSALKIGRYTPGAHIPVVGDDALVEHRPDFALLLAWNFADEIMANLRPYRDGGGEFIVPIPEPRIVRSGPARTALPTRARALRARATEPGRAADRRAA
jgi:SAM-dependent methyltransferase